MILEFVSTSLKIIHAIEKKIIRLVHNYWRFKKTVQQKQWQHLKKSVKSQWMRWSIIFLLQCFQTPYCVLTLSEFWWNANLPLFDIFEEKPRFCSFHCSQSVNIRARSVLLLTEGSWGTHGRMIHFTLFGQHTGCQTFVLFHGCQMCLVVKISKFDDSPLPFTFAYADCSSAEKFVEIQLFSKCCILAFLCVIKHNMANA